MKRAIAALICVGLLICFGTGVSEAFAQGGGKPSMTTLIIKTAKGRPEAEGQAAIRRHGGNPKSSIPKLDLHVLEVPEAAVDAITKNLKDDPFIVRVEANRSRRLAASVPSDTLLPNQWALPKIAWSDVYGTVNPQFWADVAILDTGIDGSHPDLVGTIGPGISVIDNSNGLTDPNGHGTWLSGIVAARTNNIDGIAGVGYSHVQVLPVKVLDADGNGQDSDIIEGVLWAADRRVSVILMAFSSTGFSESLQEAIDYAWSQGVVIVAAAGNDASNVPTFPAGDRGVIGVAATDSTDNLYNASNYGPSVFLAAPGVDILGLYENQSYVTWTGTSASAAIVAGVAAFMRAVDPALSNGVVVSRIARSADPAGTQTETGNGRINMARALADTSTDAIQPSGAAPIGNGGPFVGPYRAAAVQVTSITVGAQTGILTYGTSGSVTYALTVNGGNGNGNLAISVTGLPGGASFGPASFPSTGNCKASDGSCNFTLTVTTTAGTPAGVPNFTVTVDPGGPESNRRSATGALSIGTKSITGSFTAQNKTYDGNTSATILTRSLTGVSPADAANVSLTGGTAMFDTASVGTGKTITGTGFSLSGSAAGNYLLDSVAATTANITALHITGSFTADNKVYDGTTTAAVLTRSLVGILGSDAVSLTGGNAAFADKAAGNGKTVTLTGASPSGADAGNYVLDSVATTTANITALHITGSFTADNKVYDGDISAVVLTRSVTGILGSDVVSLAGGTATFNNKTVANGKLVTLAGATLSGADAGNYALDSVASATANTTPLHITGSFTADNKVYDGNTSATVLTSSLAGTIAGDAVSVTGTAVFSDKDVANDKTVTLTGPSLTGTDAGNYVLDSVSTTTANITAKHITGTFTADSKVYDGTTSATALTRSLVGTLGSDAITLSGGTAAFADKTVANGKTVTLTGASLTGADAGNYLLDSVATTIANITPLHVTGSFTADNKVYDGNTSAAVLTRSVTGILGSDVVSLAGGAATFNNKTVANGKPVTLAGATLTGADAGNYVLDSVAPATANITVLHLTGAFTAENKVYDGNPSATVQTTSLPGIIAGDTVSLTGTALFSDKNVGNGKAVTLTSPGLSGGDAGNYALDSVSSTTANITAKHITGGFTAADKVYDGNISATVPTRSLAGTVGGDAVSLNGGTATFDNKNVGGGKTVTLAGASLSGADAGNYALDSVAIATANITALHLTGSFTAQNKVYDGNTSATVLSRGVVGVLGGDAASLAGGTATFNNKTVAIGKPVTLAGASLNGADSGNYMLDSVAAATADITPLHITGSFTANNKIYDGNISATVMTSSLAGTISGDAVSLTGTPLFVDKNVGNGKTVTLTTSNLSGTDAGNYVLDSVSSTTANITAKHITGSFTAGNKVYDGNTSATVLTRSLVGAIGGDAVNLGLGTAAFDNKNVGTGKTVALAGSSLDGGDALNYVLDSVATTTANITPLTITGSFTAGNKVYDGNTSAAVLTGSVNGVLGGDAVTLVGGTAAFNNKAVANGKPVILTGASLTGVDSVNYMLGSVTPAMADITPLHITGSFTADNKIYDGNTTAAILTANLAGTIAGDAVTLGGTALFSDKNVANGKTVTLTDPGLSGADAGNYALDSVSTTMANITAKHITGSFTAADKVYDGNTSATVLTRSLVGAIGGDAVDLSGGTAAFDNKNVGNGKTVTLSGAILSSADMGNYVLDAVASTTANITALQVTGAFTAANKVYDGNTSAPILTRSVTGILGGDAVSLVGGSASFNNKSVANGKPVTLSGQSLSGADAANYGLGSVAPATANITALHITGSFTAANKVYDGTIAATVLTSTLTGTVSGDIVNLLGTATFNNKTAANSKPVTLSATGLNGADAGNYALDSVAPTTADITPAPLTAKAMDIVRMFGDPGPINLAVQYSPFVAGETLPFSGVTGSPNVGTSATPASNAGLYPIVWGVPAGVSATNYSIAFVGGMVTIVDQSKPLVTSLALSVNPVPNTATTWPSFTATISDATMGNSKIVEWSYTIDGVAAGSLAIAPASQAPTVNVGAQLSARPTGVYKICVQGKDSASNWSEPSCVLLAVYDPNGGFVTGGGWIMSPAGAYTINSALTGKANFGFVSKTQKGASVPTGQTEFQFHVAKFEFKSNVYEWLVVNGTTQAQFKGSGTVNGSGNYGFLVTAVDGNNFQTPKSDSFRIKIWDKNTGQTIYDNQLGADENSSASTNLGGDNGGGSIVIHDNGKK